MKKFKLEKSFCIFLCHTFQVTLVEIPVHPPNPIAIPVYDKDKLAWDVEPDLNADTLRIRIIHKDARNIPRNHIRYI